MSVACPDRVAMYQAQQDWPAAQQAPEYGGEQGLPTHADEVMASHQGRPAVAAQNKNNGAGTPAVDRGPAPGSVVG